ncbi:MAG: hypothetical protein ACYC7D_09545 [Nitrososphaerales archaeon]
MHRGRHQNIIFVQQSSNWGFIFAFGAFCLLIVILPYLLGAYSSKVEFYDKSMKFLRRGKAKYELNYSDIVGIGKEHYAFRRGFSLYGEGNKLLAIVPSNSKKRELGGVRVLDWLQTKIVPSSGN